MSNRSHFNPAHRAMNRLRREGRLHRSEKTERPSIERTDHRLFIADVCDGLNRVENDSVRLVICDPPYNLRLADWDQHSAYVDWASRWLKEIVRVLDSNGSLVLFGGLQYRSESGGDLLELMHYLRHQSKLKLANLIVWNYANGMSAHRFFANRHEEIAWYAKGTEYVFNLDAVREPYDAKTLKAYRKDKRLRPETLDKGRNPTNVWRIGRLNANASERTGHPTQKPRTLIGRLILALSNPGDTILDPFAGSGVTVRMAIEHGRDSIAIDKCDTLQLHLKKQLADLPETGIPYVVY